MQLDDCLTDSAIEIAENERRVFRLRREYPCDRISIDKRVKTIGPQHEWVAVQLRAFHQNVLVRFLGSSVVERSPVKRNVNGSSPFRGASLIAINGAVADLVRHTIVDRDHASSKLVRTAIFAGAAQRQSTSLPTMRSRFRNSFPAPHFPACWKWNTAPVQNRMAVRRESSSLSAGTSVSKPR